MAVIVTRAGKGSALSHAEMDANFNNLNAGETSAAAITGGTIDGAVIGGTTPAAVSGTTVRATAGLRVSEGANAKQGVATLAAGTVTVANTSVTATSRIFLTSQSDGGTVGFLRVSARTAGTSFAITSSSATDTSVVAYQIFEPA